jgi:molecular chaperone DnaK (HSP70)
MTENSNLEELADKYVLGIDLGTSNSCVSVWKNQKLEVITDEYGNRTMPSIVSFFKSLRLIGRDAKNMIDIVPKNTLYDVKRLIGLKYTDDIVKNNLGFFTYEINDDETNQHNIMITLDNNDNTLPENLKMSYHPEEISAMILGRLKLIAQNYLKVPVKKAVITVPAYFNDSQRQATKDAGKIAGLDVLRIINEPTAAAIAYGLNKNEFIKEKGIVMVYDLGGGTLDVSVLSIYDGVFQVLASTGNTHLGGEDFDFRILNYAIEEFKKKTKISEIKKVPSISYQKLKKASENAKKILSTNDNAIITVDNFYDDKTLYVTITRDIFERICNDLFIMCIKPVEDVLKSCDVNIKEVSDVVLVGGSTRMPKIQRMLKEFFGESSINLKNNVNPDEVVSAGAAIHGYSLNNNNDPFSDSIVLLDIIPLSLGIETLNEVMTTVIPRNSIIPTKKSKMFSTNGDNDTSVTIKVYEGERKLTKDNFLVGTFELSGIEPAPRGHAAIKITFEVDLNGIIQVTAHDKKTDIINSITVSSTSGSKGRLSIEEIDELVKEAELSELSDKNNYEKVHIINEIDDICHNILDNLQSPDFKLKDSEKDNIKKDAENVLIWLKIHQSTVDKNELKSKLDRLKKNYGPLILKMCNTSIDTNVKANSSNDAGVQIHGDDDIDNTSYGGITDNTENEVLQNELRAIKDTLVDLCQHITSYATNMSVFIEPIEYNFIKDYIDTVYIWIYTNSTLKINDFVNKINEVNKICSEIFSKYNITSLSTENSSNDDICVSYSQLEQLCIALKSSILSNFFSLKEIQIKILDDKLIETMQWMLELSDSEKNSYDNIFNEKINEINALCDDLYNQMLKPNIQPVDIIEEPSTKYVQTAEDNKTTSFQFSGNKIKENLSQMMDNLNK